MNPETFVCIVPSPTIPLGSKAIKVFEQEEYGAQIYAVFSPNHPKEYETWYPVTRLTREQVEQNPECWQKVEERLVHVFSNGSSWILHQTKEADRLKGAKDEELAEQKRQESIAKRLDFVPAYGEWHWRWDSYTNEAIRLDFYNDDNLIVAQWNLGNCHRTKEEAEQWGREYAHYFKIPNKE